MKKLFLLLLIQGMSVSLWAQFHGGLNFQLGIPINQFRDNTEALGVGVGGNLFVPVGESPLSVGLDMGYMIYGKDRQDQEVLINGFIEELESVTNNNLLHGHLVLRLRAKTDFILQPYLDGMFGFKYLYTRTRLVDDDFDEAIDANTDFYDWALSYGGAGGIHIGVTENVKIDLRVLFLKGSTAEYLEKGSIMQDPNVPDQLIFNSKRSRTDMLIPQIGITFFVTD